MIADAPPPILAAPLPAADPRAVSVDSTEFAFTLSQPEVSSGRVRVEFDNSRAEDPHALTLKRGVKKIRFAKLGPGKVSARTVKLRPGRYSLLCPLPQHVTFGMKASLRVIR